jgi:uncharacterized tellurite resistance protein B-like protein
MTSDVRLAREKAVMPREGSRRCRPALADQKIAQMMFRSLKTFISTLVEHERQAPAVSKLQLATAALLTRVATVHSEMSQARRAQLHAVLRSHFDLDDLATAKLLEESAAVDRTAVDLFQFTRQLNQLLNDDGRRRLVRMMWKVVYADGKVNELEDNIIWRVADLLGVSTRQRVELRQQIAPDRAVSRAGLASRHFHHGFTAPVATRSN